MSNDVATLPATDVFRDAINRGFNIEITGGGPSVRNGDGTLFVAVHKGIPGQPGWSTLGCLPGSASVWSLQEEVAALCDSWEANCPPERRP
jgi:hypothetical protein